MERERLDHRVTKGQHEEGTRKKSIMKKPECGGWMWDQLYTHCQLPVVKIKSSEF